MKKPLFKLPVTAILLSLLATFSGVAVAEVDNQGAGVPLQHLS